MKEERLVECFRMFDDDSIGKISIPELRYVLQQIGEPLTDDEADKFIDWAMKVMWEYSSSSQIPASTC